jgi:threonine/homoserine/homoserine lactone efflux protein
VSSQLPTTGPGGHPSPLPVMTILLVSALLAALGIIMVARSSAPGVGYVFLAIGIVGAVYGVWLALRNVKVSRKIQARQVAAERRAAREDDPAE